MNSLVMYSIAAMLAFNMMSGAVKTAEHVAAVSQYAPVMVAAR